MTKPLTISTQWGINTTTIQEDNYFIIPNNNLYEAGIYRNDIVLLEKEKERNNLTTGFYVYYFNGCIACDFVEILHTKNKAIIYKKETEVQGFCYPVDLDEFLIIGKVCQIFRFNSMMKEVIKNKCLASW